jgi:hypothetical protein
MNDEETMTKRMGLASGLLPGGSAVFVIRTCSLIRHSDFVIRHLQVQQWGEYPVTGHRHQ